MSTGIMLMLMSTQSKEPLVESTREQVFAVIVVFCGTEEVGKCVCDNKSLLLFFIYGCNTRATDHSC